MMRAFLKFFVGVLILTMYYGCTKSEEPVSVWDRDSQEVTDRVFTSDLVVVDSLRHSEEYGILNASNLVLEDTKLFINDVAQNEIFVIDRSTLEHLSTISPPEGQGPGEITSLLFFNVSDETVVIPNTALQKIQIWSSDGEYVNEFVSEGVSPRVILVRSDEKIITLPFNFFLEENGYLLQLLNQSGEILSGFGPITPAEYSTYQVEGRIFIDEDDNIYYSGYSEHIIKKWDVEGNLIYSVASIDNLPREMMYSIDVGSGTVVAYNQFADFHSIGGAIYGNYLIIIHAGISGDEQAARVLDIYNSKDGKYVSSYLMPNSTTSIAIDESFIYAIHTIEADRYLVRYQNDLNSL